MTAALPCCRAHCPVSSGACAKVCCKIQSLPVSAKAIPAKPVAASLQLVGDVVARDSLTAAPTEFKGVPVFQASPPGRTRLALLCSRQI